MKSAFKILDFQRKGDVEGSPLAQDAIFTTRIIVFFGRGSQPKPSFATVTKICGVCARM